MKLLVGLGNPGPRYALTRHNAGFLVLDQLAQLWACSWEPSKFDGLFAKGEAWGTPVLLLKPMGFMNRSGQSVARALQFYKLASKDMVVLHDDIDMPSGKVKSRCEGGHGGHNGVRNIIEETGKNDFHRLKLGVGRPEDGSDVAAWVLSPFAPSELAYLQQGMFEAAIIRLKAVLLSS